MYEDVTIVKNGNSGNVLSVWVFWLRCMTRWQRDLLVLYRL